MSDLNDFQITRRWPAADPTIIQLYSFPTPNGVKASIMLEETGLDYEPHLVTLAETDVKSLEFLSLNPNNKIPAIIDPNGPDGAPIGLWESGAILIYLADKTGQFIGKNATERSTIQQWLMFQMGGLGPMIGQLGYFHKFAGSQIEDPRPRDRYITETRRLLAVLNQQMAGRDWIVDAYSIADIAIAPWLRNLEGYGVRDLVGWQDQTHLIAYLDRFLDRPAVQTGLTIPARD